MPVTGQNLVDDARSRSGYQATSFVTDPEILGWTNDARRELYDEINLMDESVYGTSYGFTLPDPVLATAYATAGLGTPPPNWAALPDPCKLISGLDYGVTITNGVVQGGTHPQTVHMFSMQNRNDSSFKYKALGRFAGVEVIQVIPFERAPGSYGLWYIPALTPLTLVTSLDAQQEQFADFIGISAAIRILDKAKRDASPLRDEKERVRLRLRSMFSRRDSEAEQAGTSSDGHYTDGWPFGRRWGVG
jgi:hypothetical protein